MCALTYGSTADGVKNTQAAGGAMLVYDDHPIRLTEPELIERSGAWPAIPRSFHLPLRALGVSEYLFLRRS